jgi:predicted nucleic acid-binding Zn ribbon protein
MKERKCKHCGVKFQPKKTDQKFCSSSCRVTHHQQEKIKAYRDKGYLSFVLIWSITAIIVVIAVYVMIAIKNGGSPVFDRELLYKVEHYEYILDSLQIEY